MLILNIPQRIRQMSTRSQSRRDQKREKDRGVLTERRPEEIKLKLQQTLRRGLAIVEKAWPYHTKDQVTSIHQVDLDGDGETEEIVGSYDGRVRVFTKWGTLKWEQTLGSGVCAVVGIPYLGDEKLVALNEERGVCVLAGSRDGYVYALNQGGHVLWKYDVGCVVRQVYVNPERPDEVIIGSENGYIHALDRQSKMLLWPPYQACGVLHCLFSYDIDEDGQIELLVATDDCRIHILDSQGQHKGDLFTYHKVYALFVGMLEGKVTLLAGISNGIVQIKG
jgi:hypothetical protein